MGYLKSKINPDWIWNPYVALKKLDINTFSWFTTVFVYKMEMKIFSVYSVYLYVSEGWYDFDKLKILESTSIIANDN